MRIEEYTAQELFELLNELDETDSLEAKSLHEDSTRSIMESLYAFSNRDGGMVVAGEGFLFAA
jgi:predicted HTH transcriptional regulator